MYKNNAEAAPVSSSFETDKRTKLWVVAGEAGSGSSGSGSSGSSGWCNAHRARAESASWCNDPRARAGGTAYVMSGGNRLSCAAVSTSQSSGCMKSLPDMNIAYEAPT